MKRYLAFFAILLLTTTLIFSGEVIARNDLFQKAWENYNLVFTNPQKAFQQSATIIRQAQKENNRQAELCALSTQCLYYESNNNFEQLLTTANILYDKALMYQNPVYQTSAKIDMFNAYAFNGLNPKAFDQLKQAREIISTIDNRDLITILTRVNLFVAFSNYYYLQKDYENQLKYLQLSAQEYERFDDEPYKEKFRYIDYSNRSRVYIDLHNPDSAEYYARLSLSKEKQYGRADTQFSNFLVLGQVSTAKADYLNAVLYFQQAEKVQGYKNHLNLLALYDNLIRVYSALQNNDKTKQYEARRDSLKLNIAENQNKLLHNLLSENENDGNPKNQYLFLTGAVLLVVLILVGFLYIKRNGAASPFVNNSEASNNEARAESSASTEKTERLHGEDYTRLLEMLKHNDQAFLPYFMEIFPDFSPKLLAINPRLIQADIEFCALLKLKIPSNDIARYKHITLKSVQNKKYFIRKKLSIPRGSDIYHWFHGL